MSSSEVAKRFSSTTLLAASGKAILRTASTSCAAQRPLERLLVGVDRDGIQFDRAQQRFVRERNPALLPGEAQHERVGVDRITHDGGGKRIRVDKGSIRIRADRITKFASKTCAAKLPIRIAHEVRGRRLRRIDHGTRLAGLDLRQCLVAGRDNKIGADDEIGFAHRDAGREEIFGLRGDLHMREHGSAFLREAGHIEDRQPAEPSVPHPSSCPIVTTPVPPTPVITMPNVERGARAGVRLGK